MPVMAYSPLGQGGRLLRHPVRREVAERHGRLPAQIALAWVLRQPGVVAIPKSADPAHLRHNAGAAEIVLEEADLRALDRVFPPPQRKQALEML